MTRVNKEGKLAHTGLGLGLRFELLNEVLEAPPEELQNIQFFEVSPENYMRRGGYVPHALEQIAERHALRSHGLSLSLGGSDRFDDAYLNELRRFLDRFAIGAHSDHLSFAGLDGALLHDLLPISFSPQNARHVAARVREAASRIERPMVVENISYYVRVGEPAKDEPAFISDVLVGADCGLLLDLNNLYVNSRNHHFDAYSWLQRIPLDRVTEIHLAGPEVQSDGFLLDTHGSPVEPPVYELLEWVIARTGPLPVLLERDHNVPPLSELLSEVDSIDVVYQRALHKWRHALGGSENAA